MSDLAARAVGIAEDLLGTVRAMRKDLRSIYDFLPQITSMIDDIRQEMEEASKANVQQQEQIIGNLEGIREELTQP